MNRLFNKINKSRDIFLLLLLMSFSFLSMVFSSDSGSSTLKNVGAELIGTIQRTTAEIGRFISKTSTSVSELSNLRVEYDAVIQRLQEYERQYKEIEELQYENQRLKEILEFSNIFQYENIPAYIIAKNPSSISETFTINKGSVHGVKVNDPVIAVESGIQGLVGRVVSINSTSSKVIPITSSAHYVAGRLQKSRYEGLISGAGLGTAKPYLVMDYIDREARNIISINDLIITSGLDSLFPRGLSVGKVVGIQAQSWETSLRLVIDPVISLSKLEYVYVIDFKDKSRILE